MSLKSFLLLCCVKLLRSQSEFCDSVPRLCVPVTDFVDGCSCFLLASQESFYFNFRVPTTPTAKPLAKGATPEPKPDYFIVANETSAPLANVSFAFVTQQQRESLDLFMGHEYMELVLRPTPEFFTPLAFLESTGLFLVNRSDLVQLLEIVQDSVLFLPHSKENIVEWCKMEECRLFTARQLGYNRTTEIYHFATEIVFGSRDAEMDAVLLGFSTIKAEFQILALKERICADKCKRPQPGSKRRCHMECEDNFKRTYLPFAGRVKQEFQDFVRGTAVANFRRKYQDFVLRQPT